MLSLNLSQLDDSAPLSHTNSLAIKSPSSYLGSPAEALAWCLDIFSGGECPSDGRNDWLTRLSLFCNERGVPSQELLDWALRHSPLLSHGEKRITNTIRGNYARKQHIHGSQLYTSFQHTNKYTEGTDASINPMRKEAWNPDAASVKPVDFPFDNTPCIPEGVYAALPLLLRQAVAPFTEERERDVMLTSALAVLSGCFPSLCGTYDGTRYGANIFAFIIAPAGSGKNALRWARTLAAPAHAERVSESERARAEYKDALAEHAATKRAAVKGGPVNPEPVEPAFRLLFIPANNSAANILSMLHENEGYGIICETEADTLSASLRQDWGNFSDLLRKAFHHEPASSSRKTNREYLQVERPCLSIVLSGTPGQVVSLVPSGENGLFSRILFYCYHIKAEWRDVGPGGGRGELDDYFADLGIQMRDLMNNISLLNSGDDSRLQVELDTRQWEVFNATGRRWLAEGKALAESDGAVGVVFRLGLSMFRVTMLLTLLRALECSDVPAGRLLATDDDLNTALALGDVYLAHSLALLERMPRPTTGLITPRDKWANKAEKEQKVKELFAQGMSLRDIAQRVEIPKSTVERWVK